MRFALLVLPLLALAACDGHHDKSTEQGTSVNIKAKDDQGGNVDIKVDGKTGDVAVDVPGFEGKVSLPKISLDSSDFEIGGVTLYPGSKIQGLNVQADKTSTAGERGQVIVSFTAPADAATVAAYFREAFAKKNIQLTGSDTSLSGVSKDDGAFTISLTPGQAGQTSGKLVVTDQG